MKKLFNKIKLVYDIAGEIVSYGVQCAGPEFMDYIDMNCGAISDGPYESVVDTESPLQFLSLYVQVAHKRLAFSVSKILEFNPQALSFISDFVFKVGKNNQPQWLCESGNNDDVTPEKIYDVLSFFVLDGLNDECKVTEKNRDVICWRAEDSCSEFWKQAGGNPVNYVHLLKAFVDGFLDGSGFVFDCSVNLIERKISRSLP